MLLTACTGAVPRLPPPPTAKRRLLAAPSTCEDFHVQLTDSEDLPTNSFTLEAQEKFGIEFERQTTTYDGNSAKEQRQISLASGDYPDLYMLISWVDQFTQLELLKWSGQQGVILPLNDLIAEHGPNIQAARQLPHSQGHDGT